MNNKNNLHEQLHNMTSAASAAAHTAEIACRRLEAQQPIMDALERMFDGDREYNVTLDLERAWRKYITSGTKPT